MNYYKAVSRLFDYFYNKVYKSNFKLNLDQVGQRKMVDNFVKVLATQFNIQSVGINTLLEFFSFSFAYWSTKTTKRRISLGWIIGKKTFNRWIERKDGVDYYTDKFLLEYGVDLTLLRQELFEQETNDHGLDPAEELEKFRFEGEMKLYNCLQHTTLYHHRSLHCLHCCNRITCKRLLRNTLPQLYRRRGYANDEST